jgi:hypothetical protein
VPRYELSRGNGLPHPLETRGKRGTCNLRCSAMACEHPGSRQSRAAVRSCKGAKEGSPDDNEEGWIGDGALDSRGRPIHRPVIREATRNHGTVTLARAGSFPICDIFQVCVS